MRCFAPAVLACLVSVGPALAQPPKPPATVKQDDQRRQERFQEFGAMVIAGIVAAVLVGFAVGFVPTFIAWYRGHPNTMAIFVLNFFLGWLFIGWVIALVWACTAFEQPRYRRRVADDDSNPFA